MIKHEVEAEIFKRFFDSFGRMLGLIGDYKQDERPDFRVFQDGKIIGIELTRYSIGAGEEKQSALCEAVVKNVQLKYAKADLNKIQIFLDFNREFPILSKTKFEDTLFKLVASLSDEPTGQVSRDKFLEVKELRYIDLYAEKDNIWSDWKIIQVHSTPNFCNNQFGEIIKKKEKKSKDYDICDENWLLVSMSFMDRAQDSNVDIGLLNIHSSEIFSKIILYRMAYEDIFVFENEKITTFQFKKTK